MPRIFISYQRNETADIASMLAERLNFEFGRNCIFKYIGGIPAGIDFRQHIMHAVGNADILIALIGDDWLNAINAGPVRRADGPTDFVRLEIGFALERGLPIIPVLVLNSTMPEQKDLPPEFATLAFHNASPLRAGSDLEPHLQALIARLQLLFSMPPRRRVAATFSLPVGQAQSPMGVASVRECPEAATESLAETSHRDAVTVPLSKNVAVTLDAVELNNRKPGNQRKRSRIAWPNGRTGSVLTVAGGIAAGLLFLAIFAVRTPSPLPHDSEMVGGVTMPNESGANPFEETDDLLSSFDAERDGSDTTESHTNPKVRGVKRGKGTSTTNSNSSSTVVVDDKASEVETSKEDDSEATSKPNTSKNDSSDDQRWDPKNAEDNSRTANATSVRISRPRASEPALLTAPFNESDAERARLEWSKHLGLPVTFTNEVGMEFVLVPPGRFPMGSAENDVEADADEKPQVMVTLTRALYVAKTEVTQHQWEAVMNTAPWIGKANVKEGADFPVTYVTAEDAGEFCRKLTKLEGATYRLLTEAEWEYACRGGTITRYHFGDNDASLGTYAWFSKNTYDIGENYAHEVRCKQANQFGLHDMHGNVWEWCGDVYVERLPSGQDPAVTTGNSLRVFRGGRWSGSSSFCRSGNRSGVSPDVRDYSLGFRVARVPSSK